MRDPVRLNPLPALVERARAYFRSEVTLPFEFRRERLRRLEAAIRTHEAKVFTALKEDLGKPQHEAYLTELGIVYAEIADALKHLKGWMKPRSFGIPLSIMPGRGYRYPEPLGTALIIAPWNYPFQLVFAPLVGAIASGCNAVIKPSELAPATARVIEELLQSAFGDDGYLTTVQGDAEVSKQLLEERWDLIFFTGSTKVGQVVMEAAAKHLTPVVLELGGKSPTLVNDDADLATAARRIVWGKFINCGQTCVAPDYVLVHKNVKQALLDQLGAAIKEFYGADPLQSPDYPRIINERHFKRLQALMNGGRVVYGGQSDEAKKFIAPTVLTDVELGHPLMQEEIFGPLLPVLEVPDLGAAIKFVRERPKPLALYLFTNDSRAREEVLQRTSFGGGCVNDTAVYYIATQMPFGGVGQSGIGGYHGKYSFDVFSHHKTVVKKPFWMDLKVRYPPYKVSLNVMRRLVG